MPRELARLLIEARRTGAPIPRLPAALRPPDLAEAYAVAAEVAATLGEIGGMKVGATSPRARAMLGLGEPFCGVIPRACVLGDGAGWPARLPVTLDAELVFELSAVPEAGDRDSLRRAVRSVRLGIEVNAPRYAEPFEEGGLAIVADTGANAGLILGPALDPALWDELPALSAALSVDGAPGERVHAADALGDPWDVLRWCRTGPVPLAPGMAVASGAIVFAQAAPGSFAVADFGAAGRVSMRVLSA